MSYKVKSFLPNEDLFIKDFCMSNWYSGWPIHAGDFKNCKLSFLEARSIIRKLRVIKPERQFLISK